MLLDRYNGNTMVSYTMFHYIILHTPEYHVNTMVSIWLSSHHYTTATGYFQYITLIVFTQVIWWKTLAQLTLVLLSLAKKYITQLSSKSRARKIKNWSIKITWIPQQYVFWAMGNSILYFEEIKLFIIHVIKHKNVQHCKNLFSWKSLQM